MWGLMEAGRSHSLEDGREQAFVPEVLNGHFLPLWALTVKKLLMWKPLSFLWKRNFWVSSPQKARCKFASLLVNCNFYTFLTDAALIS